MKMGGSKLVVNDNLAKEKAAESNCSRRQVGALIVKHNSVLISAANGTPNGCTPCNQGGCSRCQSATLSGEAYDSCICIHAEQRAIEMAASNGITVQGTTMYVTLQPCIPCLNLCLHAGILDVVYGEEIAFNAFVEKAYAQFIKATSIYLRRLSILAP